MLERVAAVIADTKSGGVSVEGHRQVVVAQSGPDDQELVCDVAGVGSDYTGVGPTLRGQAAPGVARYSRVETVQVGVPVRIKVPVSEGRMVVTVPVGTEYGVG